MLVFNIRKHESVSQCSKNMGWLNLSPCAFNSLSTYHNILPTRTMTYLYYKITFETDVHIINVSNLELYWIIRHHLNLKCSVQFYCISKTMLVLVSSSLSSLNLFVGDTLYVYMKWNDMKFSIIFLFVSSPFTCLLNYNILQFNISF